jgi:hypothetical protein
MPSPGDLLASVTRDSIRLASEFALLFASDEIAAADRALDDARRLMWYAGFAGADDEAAEDWADADQRAIIIATRLRGLPLAVASQVVDFTRMTVWAAKFSKIVGSAFEATMRDPVGGRRRLDG